MSRFEHTKNRRSIWESKPVLTVLGLVLVASGWSVARFAVKMRETGENRKIAQEKVDALRDQKAALEEDIEKLKTDRGKEEIFRENYGLARTGEEVIVIVENEAPEALPKEKGFRGLVSAFRNLFK